MTKFKIKNVEELGIEECDKKLGELKLSLLKQRAQIAKGAQLENPKMVKEIRKNIARLIQRKSILKTKGTETVEKKVKITNKKNTTRKKE
jgi:large subunit ribosomal protein L29